MRQTCIDVLCAYLRLPHDPDPGDDADLQDRKAFRSQREVRHTILRLIGNHLRLPDEHPHCWCGHDFDFTNVIFDGADLHKARFTTGTISFHGARFPGGTIDFGSTEFSGSMVDFRNAQFSGSTVDFRFAMFSSGTVTFGHTMFSGGTVTFKNASGKQPLGLPGPGWKIPGGLVLPETWRSAEGKERPSETPGGVT